MSSQAAKDTRLEMRIPLNIKRTIEKAAKINGKSLSSYAIHELQASAERDIQRYETISLINEERDRFLDILTNPPRPNDSLRRLMRG